MTGLYGTVFVKVENGWIVLACRTQSASLIQSSWSGHLIIIILLTHSDVRAGGLDPKLNHLSLFIGACPSKYHHATTIPAKDNILSKRTNLATTIGSVSFSFYYNGQTNGRRGPYLLKNNILKIEQDFCSSVNIYSRYMIYPIHRKF